MSCCVVLVVPCQFPAIVINSNVWGRDSDGEWECSSVIIFCDKLRQKQKLLGRTSETCVGLGFGALIDSFSKYSLSIYHVPGTPFSTVGTPWWTQQIRPFLSWRWHGLVCKAAFHSHCLDFQLSTILCFRECSFYISATCLEPSPCKQGYFLRHRKGLYTFSL